MSNRGIKVSIICTVYNHAQYLEKTLQGFVSQKTDFRFEALIHDDASTDNSAEIIKSFEKKYPEIIKGIYQTENQYSKRVSITREILVPSAKGKYIAVCEGDDYWTDENKLQKQVEYMDSHPECAFCFTNADCEENGEITRRVVPWTGSAVVPTADKIRLDELERMDYIPTCTFLFPKKNYINMPKISDNAFRGDEYIKLGLAVQGYAHYIPDSTAVYRFGVLNSATSNWQTDPTVFKRYAGRFISLFREFNEITNGKYSEIFNHKILLWEIQIILRTEDYKKLRQKRFRVYFKSRGAKSAVKYYLMSYCSGVYKFLKSLRG